MAESGPEFVAPRVKVTFVPSAGVGLLTALVIETLAPVVGVTVAEADWVPVGSGFDWVSTAVLVIVPDEAFTVTVMVADATADLAKVPIVQVTVSLPALKAIEPVAVADET